MVDKGTKEEVEEYYKHNPSKPRAVKQYNQPAGPEHPHANVKVGSKEQGPTRADLEREQSRQEEEKKRKFKKKFEIESNANRQRLRQEKADQKEADRIKKEYEKKKKNPSYKPKVAEPYKPHPMFGRAMAEKAWGLTAPSEAPASKGRSRRTGPPRLKRGTSAGSLGYFTPARSTQRSVGDPLAFTGSMFGSLGGGGGGRKQSSELSFFTQSKGKKKKGRGGILDFTL